MIRKSFMQIFWGFLFVLLDFATNGIDVFPDVVGFILIFIGLNSLGSLHSLFSRARIFAVILIFCSLFTDFPILTQRVFNNGNVISLTSSLTVFNKFISASIFFTAISFVFNNILVWEICGGISEIATASGNRYLAKIAIRRRRLYAGLGIIVLCGIISLNFIQPSFNLLTIYSFVVPPIFIYGFWVIYLVMALIRKAALEIIV